MFGMIPFAVTAGRKLSAMIKGRKGKETLEKEVNDLGLDTTGVEIDVDDDGGVSLIGEAVSQEMKEKIAKANFTQSNLAIHYRQFRKPIMVRGGSIPKFSKLINQCYLTLIKSTLVRFCAYQRLRQPNHRE